MELDIVGSTLDMGESNKETSCIYSLNLKGVIIELTLNQYHTLIATCNNSSNLKIPIKIDWEELEKRFQG